MNGNLIMNGSFSVTDDAGSKTISINAENQEVKVGNNRVWHQGNMGSGSGLNADMLDGYDSSALMSVKEGCYVSHSGGCLSGFSNIGSAGSWGRCYVSPNPGFYPCFFRPAGGGCPGGVVGERVLRYGVYMLPVVCLFQDTWYLKI